MYLGISLLCNSFVWFSTKQKSGATLWKKWSESDDTTMLHDTQHAAKSTENACRTNTFIGTIYKEKPEEMAILDICVRKWTTSDEVSQMKYRGKIENSFIFHQYLSKPSEEHTCT